MMQDFTKVGALAAALTVVSLGSAARAQVVGPTVIIGGPGGGAFTDRCPDGALLVGMNYTGDKDINSVGPVCQKFTGDYASEAIFGLRTHGSPSGAGGGGRYGAVGQVLCPPNTAVEGIKVQVSNVNLVHGYSFVCRTPGAHDYKTTGRSALGAGAAAYEKLADCGGGAIAIGVIGRSGALVDGLGLLCLVRR